jgi:hypothetical protein
LLLSSSMVEALLRRNRRNMVSRRFCL